MNRKHISLVLLSIFLCGIAGAATATANFEVRIQIVSECRINSATDLDFGVSGVLAADLDLTSTITVQCTAGTPYSIGIGAGGGVGATESNRLMTGPGLQTIGYSLWRNAGRTLNWGTSIGVDTLAGTGTGAAQAVTVYGRVPAQATPGVGNYADTVTATITY